MKPDLVELKSALRARMRAKLREMPASKRLTASSRACDLLQQQKPWQEARSVLFYVPLDDELDLSFLWGIGAASGKILALPRYLPEESRYIACHLRSPADSLVRAKFGIREPAPDCPAFPLNQLDLAVVPGVAFDMSGWRLGRGRGFYDRLLLEVRGTKCGVAFDEQIVGEIPVEPHDVRLNCILTPTQWLSFG